MTKRIFKSILTVSICVLAVSLVLLLGCVYTFFANSEDDRMREELSLTSSAVEIGGVTYLRHLESSHRLTLIDTDGSVIYDTKGEISENHLNRPEVQQALSTGEGTGYRYSNTLLEKTHYYAKRLLNGQVLRIGVTRASVLTLFASLIYPFVIVIIVALVVAYLLAVNLSKKITRPLNSIDLDNPMSNDLVDEYSELEPMLRRMQQYNEDKDNEERLRIEFTANVSHELKTPLQGIMGSAELIERGMVAPEDLPRFTGHIREEAARLVTLVSDIIELSKLDEEDSKPAKLSSVDWMEAAMACSQELQPQADAKHIELTTQCERALVTGDYRLMYEIAYNLIDNAIRYTDEGGCVLVKTEVLNEYGILEVTDDGCGMEQAELEHIFERFYRIDKSRSKSTGGTGLGLSIVKHAVAVQGGTVTVTSAVGKGSTFTVQLVRDDQSLD